MNLSVAVLVCLAPDGRVARVSGDTTTLLGRVPEALLGVPAATLFVDDPAPLSIESEVARPRTARVLHRDGRPRAVTVTATELLSRDGSETVLALRALPEAGDGAEQLPGEEPFRSFYQNSAMGMAVCDLAGRYISVNPAMCRFVGYSENELLARTYMDITYGDDIAINVRERADLLDGHCDAIQLEKRYVHKSGRLIWALTVVSVVCDRAGRPLYTIGQMLNIDTLKKTEQALRRSRESLANTQQQIQKLIAHDNLLIEAERKRIAQEVHDDIGQLLTVLKIDMQLCRASLPGAPVLREHADAMLELIERTIGAVRDVVHHLRPPALNIGLVPALQWLAQDIGRRSRLHIDLQIGAIGAPIADEVATAIFRITQEALTNIMRHAAAATVTIALQLHSARLWLLIRDDGRGFDADTAFEAGGFGLLGMRERVQALGGSLVIEAEIGRGTTIDIEVPVP